MTITMTRNESELIVAVEGRLDTLTSLELEVKLEPALKDVKKLIFDFAQLRYISSAGLRVLLTAMQIMEEQGEMIVRNVSDDIMDVFEITGFAEDLNFE